MTKKPKPKKRKESKAMATPKPEDETESYDPDMHDETYDVETPSEEEEVECVSLKHGQTIKGKEYNVGETCPMTLKEMTDLQSQGYALGLGEVEYTPPEDSPDPDER
jgi:hypothetical protein